MKLQLDTTEKVIRIEESVGLGDLIEALDKLLPDGVWKKFKLETNTQIVWTSPIIYKEIPAYPWERPWYVPIPYTIPGPYTAPFVVGDPLPAVMYGLTSGTYCVEL